MKNKLKYRASSTSALAIIVALSFGVGASSAEPSNQILGMSRDGKVYLEKYQDENNLTAFRLVSTVTGEETKVDLNRELSSAALSADGKTVIGEYPDTSGGNEFEAGYIWTADGSWSRFNKDYFVTHVNENGSVFVVRDSDGLVHHVEATNGISIEITGNSSIIDGFQGASDAPDALAISADGTTVVGRADRPDETDHAFVWNSTDKTTVDIDTIGYEESKATHVSDDGTVVAGEGENADGNDRIFRWTATDQMKEVDGTGWEDMDLVAMSNDGAVLAGYGESVAAEQTRAYRYVAATDTLTELGTLGGGYSEATDLSGDGKVVIGTSNDADDVNHGFRWTEDTNGTGKMLSVEEWLLKAGVKTGPISTASAEFVSDDGNTIIGYTQDNEVYVARFNGIILPEQFLPTVAASNAVTVQNGVSSANTIMFGAQGNPMRNLLSVGQKSVWGTVDSGYDDNKSAKGGLFLGDFGFGYGIADGITARFSVGGTFTDQDLAVGGNVRQKGFYLSPEVSANLGNDIYATVGGYWGRSGIDINRGYQNGAALDFSKGETDAETWGAKVRFDWLNAATIADTNITPYVGVSYAHTTLDAYSETGGSFPVSYGDTKDHSTVARLGADFVHPLSDTVRVLAKAEADYQFEKQSAATTGTVIGLNDFNIAGQDLKQFWVRGGIGAEVDIGGGTASVMVNATTQGQEPDVWVRSNFTVKF